MGRLGRRRRWGRGVTAAAHIKETTAHQRRAADPGISAFVSANAGAGKTRVLTNRVARLLLEGVDPSTILCITFTKAAAAEMAERLFKLLGDWALAGDADLRKALVDLDGDERARGPDELARARRLFARALETPGGLKIQTIHSFCESVLKRFPLEAGVAPGFSVIEDVESAELKRMAIDSVAAQADPGVAAAFARLLSRMTGGALRERLGEAVGKRRLFARAGEIGWAGLTAQLAQALCVDEKNPPARADIVALIEAFDLDALKLLMIAGSKTTREAAAQIDCFNAAASPDEKFDAIRLVFLTKDSSPRKDVISKATAKNEPAFAGAIARLQDDILAILERMRAATVLEDTRAFYAILDPCLARYDAMKEARAALDFDDLIAKTRALFHSGGGAAWVLYKLDMGLEHILLDEAQDTGPDAWDVIEAPLEEFFAGTGAKARARTFFAVGDQKQSIYSFQGADAALFNEKEADLGKKIAAAGEYAKVPLNASFRTTEPVLTFVDTLFINEEVIDNVSLERPLIHRCTRDGHAGLVELWPLVKRPEKTTPDPWDAPLDATPAENPTRALAEEVATMIAYWLRSGEILESKGRPIEPGDIMILVQSRGGRSKNALFAEMIRALGAAKAPVAGADKFRLTDDQGVLDLVSYARAALYSGDDLSLAETLKSPFFTIDEESLYALAAGRTRKMLWNELGARAAERPEWARAYDDIAAARAIALKEGPVAFFTHLLETGAPSGWRRLAERLGEPCREAIEEFLRQAHDFEMRNPRSLRLFLDAILKSGAEVSREASESGPSVRVMTAHKAKGLEANIVFLIDAHRAAPVGKLGDLFAIEGPHGDDLPALALGEAKDAAILVAARDRAKRLMRDEYRRLLYVAATRARDRLYICGIESGKSDPHKPPPAEKSWHALAEDAFEALGARIESAGERAGGEARRLASPQTAKPVTDETSAAAAIDPPLPDYLTRDAARETAAQRLSPSDLAADEDGPVYSPKRAGPRFLRGRLLHRLLELLPEVAIADRRRAADRILEPYRESFEAGALDAMREEAMTVLEDPRFAAVFAPGGLAEATIGGRAKGARETVRLAGQIDRLAILEDRILIVDYKTNRPPPTQIEDVAPAYIAQLAAYRGLLQEIYPGRKIEAALLWTYDARLMPIPAAALDRAFELTLA